MLRVESARVLGVDLGGTKMLAATVDLSTGAILRRLERPTPLESQDALLAALDALVADVLDEHVVGIGCGIPSTIDRRTGEAVASVNIPLAGVGLADRLARAFGVPAAVDNDGNAAALAEWRFGAGRGTRHMVMLTLGTGIGGGLVLDGRLYRGAIGSGAEVGHMVVQHEGPGCGGGCPGRGHLEALASGTAADGVARQLLGPAAEASDLVVAAAAGDSSATAALAAIGRVLGSGLVTLVNVFNPEAIVVGGGFAAAGELVLGPAREVLATEALSPAREFVRVVYAELGPDAGVVGAALLGIEALDDGAVA